MNPKNQRPVFAPEPCPLKSYRRPAVSHCGPLQRHSMSAAFPRGKWSSVQVGRLLEAARPFDANAGASVAA